MQYTKLYNIIDFYFVNVLKSRKYRNIWEKKLGNEISFSTNYDLDTEWKIIF